MVKLLAGIRIICFIFYAPSPGGLPPGAVRAQEQSTGGVRVLNRTRSLEVVGVEQGEGSLLLTFRNNCPRRVTGLVVSAQEGSTGTVLSPKQDEMIAPGETREESFLLLPGKKTRDVVILAAFLEDCTMDGDPETVKKEEAGRRGERKLNEKLLAMVSKVLGSPKFDGPKSLDKLERETASLAERTSRSPWEEGYARRVSLANFALAKIRGLQRVHREGAKFDLKEELLSLRSLLEAKRNSC